MKASYKSSSTRIKDSPEIVYISKLKYITIQGEGNPNESLFSKHVAALYSMTYKVKMSYKRKQPPKDYEAYKIFPLEGVWDLIDYDIPATDKSNLKYTLMIQQPVFFNKELFDIFYEEIQIKGNLEYASKLKYEEIEDGLSCQMLHLGPYENESQTFSVMEAYTMQSGYKRMSKLHKEIYLSDPRRSKPENLRTVLRFKVEEV
jgi:hypothetical protein